VHAYCQVVPGPRDPHAQSGGGAGGSTGRDDLMGRVFVENRRGHQVGFDDGVIGQAGDERKGVFLLDEGFDPQGKADPRS
jgi:hypothetical protein